MHLKLAFSKMRAFNAKNYQLSYASSINLKIFNPVLNNPKIIK